MIFPNKIFEYISVGIGEISSDFPLCRQIVKNLNCGILIDPPDYKNIAEANLFGLDNPKKMKEFGLYGYNAIINGYNWDEEDCNLLKYYNELK